VVKIDGIVFGKIKDNRFNKKNLTELCNALEMGMDRGSACALIMINDDELSEWASDYPELESLLKYYEAVYLKMLLSTVNEKVANNPDFAFKMLTSKFEEYQRKTVTKTAKKGEKSMVQKIVELSRGK
jgi:hypothetical protein